MPTLYYQNPKVTDQIEFDFYTPDANGCFSSDPYKITNLKIYFVVRNLNGENNTLNLVDQFNVAQQRAYLEAQQIACDNPTDQNIANAFALKKKYEATSIYNATFYTQANIIYNVGTVDYPVWESAGPNTDSVVTKITGETGAIQNGHFKFIWSPNGTIREGDFYICWTWMPNMMGDSYSDYLHFYVSTNIANDVTTPSHIVDPNKYKNILDSYLPEMYKMSYAKDDLTVSTLDKLNYAIGDGYTVLDNLGTQLVDITDANATQEPILGYLAGFFGMPLRSTDVTLWRRQIKTAIPLCKKKGTLAGLQEALSNAGITLTNYNQLWQCRTDVVFTETFTFKGSYDFTLSNVSLDPGTYSSYFVLELSSLNIAQDARGDYMAVSLSNISISTVSGVSTMTWTGATLNYNPVLDIGDTIKITYITHVPSGAETTIYNIVKDLPLADLRDDRDFTYPPKDWNTKVIAEDDPDFATVVTQMNPFVDYLYFGKVRTKFPYSENVYNMDEYNGSLRDSQRPCDIDKSFVEPCSNGISSKYVLDVEITDLSDDRITECQSIINDFTPMHAILHTLNFSGKFEDIMLPPIEQYEALIQYNVVEVSMASMAQSVFEMARLNQYNQQSQDLESAFNWRMTTTTTGYNRSIQLLCADVDFENLGINQNSQETFLEVLSPSANSGKYFVGKANKNFIEIDQTIPVVEPINKSAFTFRLSNIQLADSGFNITQENVYYLTDDSVNFSDYQIKTSEDVANGNAEKSWSVVLATGKHNVKKFENGKIFLENNGTLSNSNKHKITWSLEDSNGKTVSNSTSGKYKVSLFGKVKLNPAISTQNASAFIGKNSYLYIDSTETQYKFYGFVDGDVSSFIVEGWDQGSGIMSGKILDRLVENKAGSLEYKGMMLKVLDNWPDIDDPTATLVDENNFKWNYMLRQHGVSYPKMYAISDVLKVGSDTFWAIDGPILYLGLQTGTQVTFEILKYSKNTSDLFGKHLPDISRGGKEVYEYSIKYSTSMMEKAQETKNQKKPVFEDTIRPNESVSIKIEHADGRIETGDL